jgi:hypothetical protein
MTVANASVEISAAITETKGVEATIVADTINSKIPI